MKVPKGFRFAGIHAGIKPNRKDLALVVSDSDSAAAGCFTSNRAKAAPIEDAEKRLPAEGVRGIVINSGNANALTGPEGLADVDEVCRAVGQALKLPREAIVAASTGVIGVRLPTAKIVQAIPRLVDSLGAEPEPAAEAIMTTDTLIKMATRTLRLDGREVTLSAICKGSGMIAPQLATTIGVVVTDCAIRSGPLASALRQAMERSFNCLTVDGDMSTNDVVFALANGQAGNAPIADPGKDLDLFTAALTELAQELAKSIAADGEGATKLLTVHLDGAPSFEVARDLARSVAGSSLVKAAVFGADPNWGRILASLGARAGTQNYDWDLKALQVSIQGIQVFSNGRPQATDPTLLRSKMRGPDIQVEISMGEGPGNAVVWGCDLSYDYVKINADYTSLIVETPGGGVAKDDRLVNYSPTFKVNVLVEALSYIDRLKGKRCVIKYGGAAMVKESLKKIFCDDIGLLRSLGLTPVVVHGGGPEITRTLDKLGHKTEFIDGMRVTSSSDLKVVEMVLTGAINTELVTLLNREFGHAVGVSGKDGALLRARKLIPEHGKDLGQVGEITSVNKDFLELLLGQGYVPVISPVGIGADGESYNINADEAAAAIASALHADKLIYLTDVPGILENGELVSEMTAAELERRLADGSISGGMRAKAESILHSLRGGVERVYIVDGRVPHGLIGELFTDRGVGTLVTR